MYKRLILLVLSIIIIICIAISFKISNLEDNSLINIEIKGEIYNEKVISIDRGSTFNDLLKLIELKDDADISSYSKNMVLYNNQIIDIPSIKEYDLISINSASLDSLCSLPGIGKSTALKIIEYRDTYGSFNTLEELKNVSGIGDKKYEKIKSYISL